MIQVYHDKNPKFFVRDGFKLPSVEALVRDYHHVANVYVHDVDGEAALERAYERTNSISQAWTDNDQDVAFLGSPDHGMDGCRSTSVGDLMVIPEGEGYATYVVASVGFLRLDGPEVK
jgi:hypothetical protein